MSVFPFSLVLVGEASIDGEVTGNVKSRATPEVARSMAHWESNKSTPVVDMKPKIS